MRVDVFQWCFVLVSVLIDENFGPLDGVLDVWELGAPWLRMLQCLRDAIVPPSDVLVAKCRVCVLFHILRPVTNCKSTELDAELPLVSHVLDRVVLLLISELLMRILLDPLVEVAWHGWEVRESWLMNSILVLTSDDEWRALLLSGLRVQVHASTSLHARRLWLLGILSDVGHVTTFNNLDFEIYIRMERNWLAADWGPREGSAVNVV